MNAETLISVIVPVYNVERYLEKCVASICAQTYKKLEIILVDDGSTDSSGTICDKLAKEDSRIVVIYQKNAGLSEARNAGLEIAKGEYLGFIDSDDYIVPQMYEKMLGRIYTDGSDMALCSFVKVDEYGNQLGSVMHLSDSVISGKDAFLRISENAKFNYGYILAWNKLYKKELFNAVRFPVGKVNEDLFTIPKILFASLSVSLVKESFCFYVQREKSIMGLRKTTIAGSVALLDEFEAFSETALFADTNNLLTGGILQCAISCYFSRRFSFSFSDGIPFRKKIAAVDSIAHRLIKKYKKFFSIKVKIKVLFSGLYHLYLSIIDKIRYAVLRREIRRSESILFYTPTYGNVGDHAIALAEDQFLKKIKCKFCEVLDSDVGYVLAHPELVKPNQKIVLTGGGFLGCLWPEYENDFRRIVKAFPGNKIIVFPQTVTFKMNTPEGYRFFEQSKEVYERAVLFLREYKSHNFIKTYMPSAKAFLCPDMVLGLAMSMPECERKGILFCLRHDIEKNLSELEESRVQSVLKLQYPSEPFVYADTVLNHGVSVKKRKREVCAKLKEFASSKLVITDRLHGMVFAAITNTPCVFFDNSNGKVSGVYEWIKHLDYVKPARSADDLQSVLNTLDITKKYQYSFDAAQYDELKEALVNE